MKKITESIARFIERRHRWLVITAVILSVAAVPGITMLKTETGFDAFVSPDTKIAQDTFRYEEEFGSDPITVLLSGHLDDIFSTGNLAIMSGFFLEFSGDENCRSVLGPTVILQQAVEEAIRESEAFSEQIALAQDKAEEEARQTAAAAGLSEQQQEEAAQAARAAVYQEFLPQITQMQAIGEPSLDNPVFVKAVIYDAQGEINQGLQSFIPDNEHALIIVTPRGNLSDEAELQITSAIEDYFTTHPLSEVTVTAASSSKLISAISNSMGKNMAMLLGISVVVMIIILMGLFRVRMRLLSLIMVGTGAVWTFGLAGYMSVPVTMATMAILPILIGLGIDYSIQFHNRYQEELTREQSVGSALTASITNIAPIAGIALIASIIGFITLFISEVPMIKDFGMMLAIGIILSFIVGLVVLHSLLVLFDRKKPIGHLRKASIEATSRIDRVLTRIGQLAIKHTLAIFIIALVFGIVGAVVDQWLPTNTDYEELIPQDTPELIELRNLREITGSGGEIKFMLEAENVNSSAFLSQLKEFQDAAMAQYPEIIAVNSLATLVGEAANGIIPADEQIELILDNTSPLYLSQVVSEDFKTASISFNIKYIPLEQTHDLIQFLQDDADSEGIRISPVGNFAIGASIIDTLVGKRLNLNLICIGAILLALLLIYRRFSITIFTIIPVGAIIAWSSLDMYIIGIPLNPLTAILGVIVIGICTEFMVLLLGRYEEEKKLGLPPKEAMVTAISKIGRAIVVTALTTIGGFGVLISSNFIMIRDFGIATVIGVLLCLIITITVMPGLIVRYDNLRKKRN